jgi:hypothetical protein
MRYKEIPRLIDSKVPLLYVGTFDPIEISVLPLGVEDRT